MGAMADAARGLPHMKLGLMFALHRIMVAIARSRDDDAEIAVGDRTHAYAGADRSSGWSVAA